MLIAVGLALDTQGCSVDPRELSAQSRAETTSSNSGSGGAAGNTNQEVTAGSGDEQLAAGAPASGAGGAPAEGGSAQAGGVGAVARGGAQTAGVGGLDQAGGVPAGGAAFGGAATGGVAGSHAGGAGLGGASASGGTAGVPGGAPSTGGFPTTAPSNCSDLDGDGVSDCVQTLVKDATFDNFFDQAPTDWQLDPALKASWDYIEGCLVLTSDVAGNAGMNPAGVAQCIPTAAGTNYIALASSFTTDGGAFAQLKVSIFAQQGCQGAPTLETVSPLDGNTDSWRLLQTGLLHSANGNGSMLVELNLLKQPSVNRASVRFDNVLVRAKP